MTGMLGRKMGMSAVFENGRQIPVTVLEVGPCPVVQAKTIEKDSYSSLQLAFEETKSKSLSKSVVAHLEKAGVTPHRILSEFRDFEGDFNEGDMIKADLFNSGEKVHVTGLSKGRGFAGVIKRHGFNRPNQSHGTHEKFRGPGSVGQASYPARVWPGKKMPGRMGGSQVTVKNLRIVNVDVEKGILLVKGAVPGANGGLVRICKAG